MTNAEEMTNQDILTEDEVQKYLYDKNCPVRVFDETNSTNIVAKEWAKNAATQGSMVLASRQTAGKGRMGRSFISPDGGIYMSIILRPDKQQINNVYITALAAVAVCRAVKRLCGISLGIKWVNDLFYSGKKCCGILTEAATNTASGKTDYIVVGIGLNYVTQEKYFDEIGNIATSIYPSGKAPVPRARLIAEIHNNIVNMFKNTSKTDFLPEYRRLNFVIGQKITVMAKIPYIATAKSIDDEARLVVEKESGEIERLSFGEISIEMDCKLTM